MSKERELLQRAKILLDCVCTSPVQKEIEELLAQPEQPTLEPLSDEKITDLVDKYHGYPKTLCRAIEVEHGIGVDYE